jgi:DNA-binding HxlR family transcriptional regulator
MGAPLSTGADRIEGTSCVRAALQVLDGKWTLEILWQLREGPQRYGDLRRAIPAISDKVLTQHLRELERDGMVEREVRDAKPPQVSYCFSVYGRTLIPLIQGLCAWGEQHVRRHSRSDGL